MVLTLNAIHCFFSNLNCRSFLYSIDNNFDLAPLSLPPIKRIMILLIWLSRMIAQPKQLAVIYLCAYKHNWSSLIFRLDNWCSQTLYSDIFINSRNQWFLRKSHIIQSNLLPFRLWKWYEYFVHVLTFGTWSLHDRFCSSIIGIPENINPNCIQGQTPHYWSTYTAEVQGAAFNSIKSHRHTSVPELQCYW